MPPEFTVGSLLPGNDQYKILDKSGRGKGRANPLGTGNVGVVFLADYKGLQRAIKFLSPKLGGDAQAQLALDILKVEFAKEQQLLSRITHTGICKIVDFGSAAIGAAIYDYYVMDFIEGNAFDTYWRICSATDFLMILDQLLDALAYLHAQDHFHMDVKEENVRIQLLAGAQPHAILLDLGGAKHIPTSRHARIPLRDETIYISTEKATRPERRDDLGKPVRRHQLMAWNVDLDLYAVGAMIARALNDPVADLRSRVAADLTPSGLEALEWVVARLTEGSSDTPIEQRYYQSATQVRADLSRLFPQYTWPLGLRELSVVVAPASIQLPTERVGLTPELLELVNHPLFQRLHNIPQLEYIHLIYPGARKSRFEHALATFQLARLFLLRLLEDPAFRMVTTPDHIQASLLAALLHDIGHYPLSHMFEDFIPLPGESWPELTETILSDEDLFHPFVCPGDGDLISEHVMAALPHADPFHKVLKKHFPKASAILPDLVRLPRDAKTPLPQLHGVIDSSIDVDKIRYLSDDSSATGVQFGRGMDINGLLDALVPPRGTDLRDGVLAITENGLPAAESVILARFWMISRVYWHRTNRAVMGMHKFVIAELLRAGRLRFDEYIQETLLSSQSDATSLLSDYYDALHPETKLRIPTKRNPLHGLLDAGRAVYKRLLSISNGPAESDNLLYSAILQEGPFGTVRVGEVIRKHLKTSVPGWDWQFGDVVVDIPRKRRDVLGSSVLVYLDRDPNKGQPLTGRKSVSPLLQHMGENFADNVKRCRICIHPDAMTVIVSKNIVDSVRDGVRRLLEEYYDIDPGIGD